MTSGAEAFKAAFRRSALLIVFLVLLGGAALVTIRHVEGPRYRATARVLISSQNLGEAITGTQPPFVDPQRFLQTASALADSPELYARAAARNGGSLGSGPTLQAATSVSAGDNNILSFAASSSDPKRAVGIANAVARAYIAWRSDVLGQSIRQAIAQVRTKLPTAGANLPALRRQLDTLELMQTLNTDATLVDHATSATKTRPTPVRDGLLGASIGLVIALLLVAAREAIDTTVRSESDVEDILGAPVLASIRPLPRRTRMVTFGRHETAYGDAYAVLAATLAHAPPDARARVIAVTSAISSEGKTTTAANLAVALARRGSRVVLADFDFRKPAVAPLFAVPDDAPGILQVLDGSAATPKIVWQVPLDAPKPASRPLELSTNGAGSHGPAANGAGGRLWVLPAGGSLRSYSDLELRRLPDLLQELRSRADFVVLDTPPALLTAEMAELADDIDSVLIVVRHGRVTHRSLRSLNRQTRSWVADIAGAVFTDVAGKDQYSYYRGR